MYFYISFSFYVIGKYILTYLHNTHLTTPDLYVEYKLSKVNKKKAVS